MGPRRPDPLMLAAIGVFAAIMLVGAIALVVAGVAE